MEERRKRGREYIREEEYKKGKGGGRTVETRDEREEGSTAQQKRGMEGRRKRGREYIRKGTEERGKMGREPTETRDGREEEEGEGLQ
jgi:hypothetical protein